MTQTLGKRPANDWLKTVLDVTPLSVLFRLKNVVYDVAALYTVKYLIKEVGINTAISTLDKKGFENSMCSYVYTPSLFVHICSPNTCDNHSSTCMRQHSILFPQYFIPRILYSNGMTCNT